MTLTHSPDCRYRDPSDDRFSALTGRLDTDRCEKCRVLDAAIESSLHDLRVARATTSPHAPSVSGPFSYGSSNFYTCVCECSPVRRTFWCYSDVMDWLDIHAQVSAPNGR